MYNVLILLSTNIHEDVISNCKYCEFIQIVCFIFVISCCSNTILLCSFYYIILLYVCNYKYIRNYIINYIISNHTKILIISYSSSRLHKMYIS